MSQPDRNSCQLCRKTKPAWWCIDSTPNHHAYTDASGVVRDYECGAMYPVCQRCRDQMERDMRRGRKVEWIEWSDHVQA